MTQESFSRLWEGYQSDSEAKTARDRRLRELRKQGKRVKGFCLRNQLRKYAGLGQPDGRFCHVYMIHIFE